MTDVCSLMNQIILYIYINNEHDTCNGLISFRLGGLSWSAAYAVHYQLVGWGAAAVRPLHSPPPHWSSHSWSDSERELEGGLAVPLVSLRQAPSAVSA